MPTVRPLFLISVGLLAVLVLPASFGGVAAQRELSPNDDSEALRGHGPNDSNGDHELRRTQSHGNPMSCGHHFDCADGYYCAVIGLLPGSGLLPNRCEKAKRCTMPVISPEYECKRDVETCEEPRSAPHIIDLRPYIKGNCIPLKDPAPYSPAETKQTEKTNVTHGNCRHHADCNRGHYCAVRATRHFPFIPNQCEKAKICDQASGNGKIQCKPREEKCTVESNWYPERGGGIGPMLMSYCIPVEDPVRYHTQEPEDTTTKPNVTLFEYCRHHSDCHHGKYCRRTPPNSITPYACVKAKSCREFSGMPNTCPGAIRCQRDHCIPREDPAPLDVEEEPKKGRIEDRLCRHHADCGVGHYCEGGLMPFVAVCKKAQKCGFHGNQECRPFGIATTHPKYHCDHDGYCVPREDPSTPFDHEQDDLPMTTSTEKPSNEHTRHYCRHHADCVEGHYCQANGPLMLNTCEKAQKCGFHGNQECRPFGIATTHPKYHCDRAGYCIPREDPSSRFDHEKDRPMTTTTEEPSLGHQCRHHADCGNGHYCRAGPGPFTPNACEKAERCFDDVLPPTCNSSHGHFHCKRAYCIPQEDPLESSTYPHPHSSTKSPPYGSNFECSHHADCSVGYYCHAEGLWTPYICSRGGKCGNYIKHYHCDQHDYCVPMEDPSRSQHQDGPFAAERELGHGD